MAFVRLVEEGYLKFIISQNVDGLHRKSGIPPEKLAELHGNVNFERCAKCGKEVMRDFNVGCTHDHITGRLCAVPGCQGALKDNIINFGENLPKRDLRAGFDESLKADLCLAMGSSLRVTPAADMPAQTAEKGGKLVIVKYFCLLPGLACRKRLSTARRSS
jgi:NAD-dependent SIR2 family protein deacetylase